MVQTLRFITRNFKRDNSKSKFNWQRKLSKIAMIAYLIGKPEFKTPLPVWSKKIGLLAWGPASHLKVLKVAAIVRKCR